MVLIQIEIFHLIDHLLIPIQQLLVHGLPMTRLDDPIDQMLIRHQFVIDIRNNLKI
jgi:hypothetical protein